MTSNKWRKDLDLLTEKNLKELILETKEFDYAISKARDRGKAQIWVALALINTKLNKILVQDKKYLSKIEKKELDKILNTLETL